MLIVSDATRTLAGILLLTITTIQFGGAFMLLVVRGKVPATELQRAFFRAGHAHAGVLVMLALVTQLFVDASDLDGFAEVVARDGIAAAAILIPAGFFLSVARPGATRPSRLLVLLWVGVVSLAAAVVTLGIGLLTT
jgi:hypothetical protein